MPLAVSPLKHRVSRRILTAFLLAAVLPVVALAAWTLARVSTELTAQAQQEAYAEAKALGMAILRQLRFAGDQLRLLSHQATHQEDREALDLEALEERSFLSLFSVDPDGKIRQLWGESSAPPQVLPHQGSGEPPSSRFSLRVAQAGAHAEPAVYLWLELDNGGYLGGRLDHQRLWNTENLAPLSEQACVLDSSGAPLYCNRPPATAWLQRASELARSEDVSRFVAAGRDEPLISAAWSVFLAPHYGLREWTVALGVPESDALAPVALFRQVFPMITLIALILAAWLSLRLIRRNLRPLERLIQATRAISSGRFEAQTTLRSDDEFQELGEALNSMAAELGAQFGYLERLVAVGQRLQGARSVTDVLETVRQACTELVGADACGVLGMERTERAHRLWHYPLADAGATPRPEQHPLRDGGAHYLPSDEWCGPAAEARNRCPLLSRPAHEANAQLLLLPARRGHESLGAIVLRYPTERSIPAAELQRLRQLAHLLAVALHNVNLSTRLYLQANQDPLTGLPNRRMLEHRVKTVIAECQAKEEALAVIIFDLDRFNLVNDVQGHALGDAVLLKLVERLGSALGPEVMLSRFAGDEFVALLRAADEADAERLARQLINHLDRVLQRPLRVTARGLQLTASKGVAIYPRDGATYAALLQNADAAMYTSKRAGPGRAMFFSQQLQSRLLQRADMEAALRQAVPRGELQLYFQPLIGLTDRRVLGAEALVRWERPGHGLVPPGVFIPLAEQIGVIEVIGSWVLTEACRAMTTWRAEGRTIGHVAVNVSGQQLKHPDFPEQVAAILHRTGLPPKHLVLEVTETAFIEDKDDSFAKLQRLRDLGIRIAIDDFGTGYASMEYLRSLPADTFKIDRLFIKELPDSARDVAIIKSLQALAEQLGLHLIAEGVETAEQAALLTRLGVEAVQGYHFSRPLPGPEFRTYVAHTGLPETPTVRLARG